MPYASIIIPTHDRAETLPYSVRSALGQTVSDVEVLIVGDGCTARVRDVARAFVKADERVRFLDLPKAPLRGVANRHEAILSASAEKIFYNDDDDLLLPHHVETLGQALEQFDVVDTPPASVNVDGSLMLGVHDSGHSKIREMLQNGLFKGVFDTHLAHRRAAYLAGPGAWLNPEDRRVVLHFLNHFLASELSWTSLQRTTALSFHGMARFGMPVPDRARELDDWFSLSFTPGREQGLRARGSFVFHSLRLLRALHSAGSPKTFGEILGKTPITSHQESRLRTLVALVAGGTPGVMEARLVLEDLLEARLGPTFPTGSVIAMFRKSFTPGEIREMLSEARARPAVCLAAFQLSAQTGIADSNAFEDVAEAFSLVPTWTKLFFGLSIVEGCLRLKNVKLAWNWLEALRPFATESFHACQYWQLREAVALQSGRVDELSYARERVAALSDLSA